MLRIDLEAVDDEELKVDRFPETDCSQIVKVEAAEALNPAHLFPQTAPIDVE